MLFAVDKVALVEGSRAIDFTGFALGQVIEPVALVEHFRSGEFAVAVGLVVPDGALVESGGVLDEERVLAIGSPVAEAALVEGAVIVDHPSVAMGSAVFPLALVIARVAVDIVKRQFGALPL